MSVTRDHSLKPCLHFPAFLLFYWQSICRVVGELKSFRRVTLPSQLSERYCIKKNNNNNKKKMPIFFMWSISQNSNANSKFRTLLVCFKRGNLSKSYCDIDLESFSFLFESKDIMNILLTSLFSVRPVSYGTSFFPHAWHLGHIPERKKIRSVS